VGPLMKRRISILLILLLAGAVVNVAVAWGCAFWVNPTWNLDPASAHIFLPGEVRSVLRIDLVVVTHFEAAIVRDASFQRRDSSEVTPEQLSPDWANLGAPSPELRTADTPERKRLQEARHLLASGWPLRALWAESLGVIVIDEGSRRRLSSQGGYIDIRLPDWPGNHRRVLPLRPIWRGFAINTLFYAALLWLPFVLRRFVRLKRGLCPACAYPRAESDVCSECGHPVHSAAPTRNPFPPDSVSGRNTTLHLAIKGW